MERENKDLPVTCSSTCCLCVFCLAHLSVLSGAYGYVSRDFCVSRMTSAFSVPSSFACCDCNNLSPSKDLAGPPPASDDTCLFVLYWRLSACHGACQTAQTSTNLYSDRPLYGGVCQPAAMSVCP